MGSLKRFSWSVFQATIHLELKGSKASTVELTEIEASGGMSPYGSKISDPCTLDSADKKFIAAIGILKVLSEPKDDLIMLEKMKIFEKCSKDESDKKYYSDLKTLTNNPF